MFDAVAASNARDAAAAALTSEVVGPLVDAGRKWSLVYPGEPV
jgi:hypothetical protein